MYLEPQVFVKPGENKLAVRAVESSTTSYGTYSVKTTEWRDYNISVNAEPGKRYYVIADLNNGVKVIPEKAEPKGTKVAFR